MNKTLVAYVVAAVLVGGLFLAYSKWEDRLAIRVDLTDQYADKNEEINSSQNEVTINNNTTMPIPDANTKSPETPAKRTLAKLETSKGTVTLELFSADAPKTVANFVKLAKSSGSAPKEGGFGRGIVDQVGITRSEVVKQGRGSGL